MRRLAFLCALLTLALCLSTPASAHFQGACAPVGHAYYPSAGYFLPPPALYVNQPAQALAAPIYSAPTYTLPAPVPVPAPAPIYSAPASVCPPTQAYSAPAPAYYTAPSSAYLSTPADAYSAGYSYTPGVPVYAGYVYRDGFYRTRSGSAFTLAQVQRLFQQQRFDLRIRR